MNQTYMDYIFSSGQKLQIAQGDITDETVDAVVNAANAHLLHGAGVAGAIVRRGGPIVQAESNQWVREHGPVTHAEPAYTHAGNLPCRYIIHAVGPVWGKKGDEQEKLEAATRGSLRLADQLGIESIAFPAISTGVFGFPKLCAAEVILYTIRDYFTHNPASSLKLVRLVLFDQETLQAFLKSWEQDDHLHS
jgi:O-acetyl-ADP-ribose deacetylase (regulator of RNase III)